MYVSGAILLFHLNGLHKLIFSSCAFTINPILTTHSPEQIFDKWVPNCCIFMCNSVLTSLVFQSKIWQSCEPLRTMLMLTGIYIGWRLPEFKHDCQRVNDMSKCFCGHLLGEHAQYTGLFAADQNLFCRYLLVSPYSLLSIWGTRLPLEIKFLILLLSDQGLAKLLV